MKQGPLLWSKNFKRCYIKGLQEDHFTTFAGSVFDTKSEEEVMNEIRC